MRASPLDKHVLYSGYVPKIYTKLSIYNLVGDKSRDIDISSERPMRLDQARIKIASPAKATIRFFPANLQDETCSYDFSATGLDII